MFPTINSIPCSASCTTVYINVPGTGYKFDMKSFNRHDYKFQYT